MQERPSWSPGGRFLVQGIGTEQTGGGERVSASRLLRAMWGAALSLADEGMLDREMLEEYVFPVYCRSPEEVTAPTSRGGALAERLETVSVDVVEVANPYWEAYESGGDAEAYATAYVQFVRAFAESTMLSHLFKPGAVSATPEHLCDRFFELLREQTAADPAAGRYEAWVVRAEFRRLVA